MNNSTWPDTEDNFYFDLVDLARRLLLTGGLILIGEQSNTQIFLGALLCVIWLMLVTVRRPYEAYWDNVLSIVLSLQLVLIMLCGMALEMNRLTPKKAADPYERNAFGALMVAFSIVIVSTSIVAIIITIPCLRDRLVEKYVEKFGGEEEGMQEEEEQEQEPPAKKKRRLSSRDLIKKVAAEEKESNANPEIGIEMTQLSNPMAVEKSRRRSSKRVRRLSASVKVRRNSQNEPSPGGGEDTQINIHEM